MARPRKWGSFPSSSSFDEAFENAKTEIEELYEEMDEWRNNMEQSDGLSQTEKFSEVEEAADTLDSAKEQLEAVDFSELKLPATVVAFSEIRKRSYPRHVRCTNAVAKLEAVRDFLQGEANKTDDAEMGDILEEQVGYIEEATGELECISFPGMF